MRTVTCKLSEKLDAELEAAAREEGVSKSQVLRNALANQIGRSRGKKKLRAYDLVEDLSGSVRGPAALLSNPKYMDNFGA
jgi:hypothetical protein